MISVNYKRDRQTGLFVFLCKNRLLPNFFNDMFVFNNRKHDYNTRNTKTLQILFCRTKLRQFSIWDQGSKCITYSKNSLDKPSAFGVIADKNIV